MTPLTVRYPREVNGKAAPLHVIAYLNVHSELKTLGALSVSRLTHPSSNPCEGCPRRVLQAIPNGKPDGGKPDGGNQTKPNKRKVGSTRARKPSDRKR